MWLTGFDVKSLATLYLDKPMKGHTLMQAIGRLLIHACRPKTYFYAPPVTAETDSYPRRSI